MRLTRVVLRLLLCCLLFPLSTLLFAQTTQWGTPRFHASLPSTAESVNANNLDGTLAIPVISKAGRGVRFYLTRVYNSAIYTNAGGQFQPVGTQPTSASSLIPYWGWLTQSPAGTMAITWQSYSCQCMPPNCPYCGPQTEWYQSMGIVFYDASGRSHIFSNLGITTPNPCNTGVSTGYGSDGQGWGAYGDLNNSANDTVTAPNGWVYHYSGWVEDTNGNEVTQNNPSGSESDFYDTTSLEAAKVVSSTNCVNPVDGQTYPQCVTYSVLQPGSTSTYTAAYTEYDQNISVNSGACTGVTAYSGTATVPVYGVLPEYTSGSHWYYHFGYDGAGRVSSITYPTGATVSYSYGSLCTFEDGGPDSVTKTVNDNNGNVTTFTLSRSSSQTTETVTDASSHILSKQVVTYDTSTGLPTDEKWYDTDGTTVLKEVAYTNSGGYPQTVTTSLNGVAASEADLTFDSYGNLHQQVLKDLARDSSGNTKQITTINYLNSSAYLNLNITDKPTQQTVTDGTGAVLANTVINYDSYSAGIVASGDPEHDSSFSTSYTTRANPTSIVRSVSGSATLTTSFDYNDAGQVLTTHDANGNAVTTSYSSSVCGGVYPTSQAVPGGTVSYTFDCGTGLLTATQDQNGAAASASYDVYGRLTQATAADGGVTTYGFDDPNNTSITTKIDGATSMTSYQVTDGLGRAIYAQTQAPAGWDTVETVYDGLGRAVKVSEPYNTGHAPGAGSAFTITTYDGLGRPLTVTAPDGSHSGSAYSANAVQVTDARGVQKVMQTDGLGHLWKVCEVSGQSGASACGTTIAATGFLTRYTYDMAGRLTAVNQNGQSRSFTFDELGRTLTRTDPESGTTDYTYDSVSNGACPAGSSGSAGDLVLVSDASGMSTCFKYDAWHRVTAKAFSTGQSYTYTWDGSPANYLNGRLASAAAPSTSVSFTYDAMGRPLTVSESPSPLSAQTTDYSYNYLGEMTSMTAPSGKVTNYSYDVKARLTAATGSGGLNYLDGRTFNAADQITAQTFGDTGSAHAMTFTASYNNMLQPWQLSYAPSSGSALTLQYQWGATIDASGDVTSNDNNGTLRALIDATSSSRTITYGYDDMNRISSAHQSDGTINTSYTIDSEGNLFNSTFTDNSANNRLNGLTYDGAGRVLAGTWGGVSNRQLTWDPEGKMLTYADAGTSTITYSYDPFGRRVMAQQSGAATQYWFYGAGGGDHPVAEYNGAWQTDIQVEGTTIATVDSANNVTYLAVSMLKTTKMTVSGGGVPSGVATYYPYGGANASITSEYKFTNQIRDPNGIDHFWMRSYSPDLGRWLTPDPAGMAAVDPTNPQSWNRYAYVLNNPASAFDPLGLSASSCSGTTSQGPSSSFCFSTTGVAGLTPPATGDLSGAVQLAIDASSIPMPSLNGSSGNYGWGTGGQGGGFDFGQLPIVQHHDRVCYGKAHVLRGNPHFLGVQGALGFIGYHTAAVSYEQFGFRTSTEMRRSGGVADVSGLVGLGAYGPDFYFTLSDINGGHIHPGYPNVRAMLRARYPGRLIVELPGLPGTRGDPGTQPVTMLVPWRWNCPEGTHV